MSLDQELKSAEASALLHAIQTSLWKVDVWTLRCLIEAEKTEASKSLIDDLRKINLETQAIIKRIRELRKEIEDAGFGVNQRIID